MPRAVGKNVYLLYYFELLFLFTTLILGIFACVVGEVWGGRS